MRIGIDRYRFATEGDGDSRLQVAHLHNVASLIQFSQQSVNDRTLAGSVWTKNDDLQFAAFL